MHVHSEKKSTSAVRGPQRLHLNCPSDMFQEDVNISSKKTFFERKILFVHTLQMLLWLQSTFPQLEVHLRCWRTSEVMLQAYLIFFIFSPCKSV